MKKLFTMFLVCCMMVLMVGCGSQMIDGKKYERIGLMELDEMKPYIQYDLGVWNALTIIIPVANIFNYGWYLYKPIGVNKDFENYVKSIK